MPEKKLTFILVYILLLHLVCLHTSVCRLLAFIKKFDTVLRSKPSSSATAICISLEGFLVSLNIANRARFWESVNCRRAFFDGGSTNSSSVSLLTLDKSISLAAAKKYCLGFPYSVFC